MNILMIYPKFPEQTFWNTSRSDKLLTHLYRQRLTIAFNGMNTLTANNLASWANRRDGDVGEGTLPSRISGLSTCA